jgi:cytochrome c-type biogenesis protein CcmF
VIYAGKNPDTGQPIIRIFLNPLVAWIWIGVAIIVFGTAVALVPNMSAALAASRVRAVEVHPEVVAAQGGD